jgi:hypothetical protein
MPAIVIITLTLILPWVPDGPPNLQRRPEAALRKVTHRDSADTSLTWHRD